MKRHIAVVTAGRSDYGYYLPVLRRLRAEPDMRVSIIATGSHLVPELGFTIQAIEADGFEITEQVEMTLAGDSATAIATSIGLGVIDFAHTFSRLKPDLLLLLGDRYEMLAAGCAVLPFSIPVAHIAGGELSEGAMDELIRHALTKMSHLHFVSTECYRRRVIQMGEDPKRVFLSGAPSLDNLANVDFMDRESLERLVGMKLAPAPILVTYHPVTRESEETQSQLTELLAALEASSLPAVFTFPGADTNWRTIVEKVQEYVSGRPQFRLVMSLGTRAYFSLLKHAALMVGNSSSGIIEAASFKLPVINVGNRQRGRLHAENVIDVPCEREAILQAIRRGSSEDFRHSLSDLRNPYGSGRAADVIVEALKGTPLDHRLVSKSFYDLPGVPSS